MNLYGDGVTVEWGKGKTADLMFHWDGAKQDQSVILDTTKERIYDMKWKPRPAITSNSFQALSPDDRNGAASTTQVASSSSSGGAAAGESKANPG